MKLWQKEYFITLNFEKLCLTVLPLSSGMYDDLENIVYMDLLIQGTYISTTHGCIKHTFFWGQDKNISWEYYFHSESEERVTTKVNEL